VASSAGRTTTRPLGTPLSRRTHRVQRPRQRRLAAFVLVLVLVAAGVAAYVSSRRPAVNPLRARIVALAQGQVGYRTDPSDTYCNKVSAYWNAGVDDCGGDGNLDEEWCADFAAWAWKEADAVADYRLAPGYLNGNSASFYVWGINHDTWHPVGSGYTPQPGDVAVYGLDTSATTAVHVAVVTAASRNDAAPDVINGDGDHTGFSVVETGDHQAFADVKGKGAPLSGYVSPLSPPSAAATS
jgi:CHAP domain